MLKWEHFGSAGECVLVEKKYYGCTVLYVVRGQIEYDIYRPVLDELIMLLHLGRCAADSKEVYHPSSPPHLPSAFGLELQLSACSNS